MTDEVCLWERLPHDTPTSWAVLRAYLEQDPPRSLLDAYNTVKGAKGDERKKRVPGRIYNRLRGRDFQGNPIPGAPDYQERVEAWDNYLAALERQKWIDRRLKIREEEWDVGSRLLERGKEMLMFPVFRQIQADNSMIIEPADWRLKDIPVVLEKASKLLRLSTGMSTENVQIDWREEAKKEGYDPDELFNQVLSQIKEELEQSALDGASSTGSLEGSPEADGGDEQGDV
jgi:hypothetical protein